MAARADRPLAWLTGGIALAVMLAGIALYFSLGIARHAQHTADQNQRHIAANLRITRHDQRLITDLEASNGRQHRLIHRLRQQVVGLGGQPVTITVHPSTPVVPRSTTTAHPRPAPTVTRTAKPDPTVTRTVHPKPTKTCLLNLPIC